MQLLGFLMQMLLSGPHRRRTVAVYAATAFPVQGHIATTRQEYHVTQTLQVPIFVQADALAAQWHPGQVIANPTSGLIAFLRPLHHQDRQ